MTDGQSERRRPSRTIATGHECPAEGRRRDMIASTEELTELAPVVDLVPRVVRGPSIVAYVMSDGTVREPGKPFDPAAPLGRFRSGQLTGRGWTLWWDRRSLAAG